MIPSIGFLLLPLLWWLGFLLARKIYRKTNRPSLAFFTSLSVYLFVNLLIPEIAMVFIGNAAPDAQFLMSLIMYLFIGDFAIYFFQGTLIFIAILIVPYIQSTKVTIIPTPQKKYTWLLLLPIILFCIAELQIGYENLYGPISAQPQATSTAHIVQTVMPYDECDQLTDIGGKIGYVCTNSNGPKERVSSVVLDGQIINDERTIAPYSLLENIADKPVYYVVRDGEKFIVSGDTEYLDTNQYFFDIGGSIAFKTTKDDNGTILFNNIEYGQEYDRVMPVSFNNIEHGEGYSFAIPIVSTPPVPGVPTFFGIKGNEIFAVAGNEKIAGPFVVSTINKLSEFGIEKIDGHVLISISTPGASSVVYVDDKKYDNLFRYKMMDGELVYATENESAITIFYKDRTITENFGARENHSFELFDVAGQVGYIKKNLSDNTEQFFIDQMPLGDAYDDILNIAISTEGKVALEVKDKKEYKIILDGVEIDSSTTAQQKLTFIGENIFFVLGKNRYDKTLVLYYRDGIVKTDVNYLGIITSVGGKLAVFGETNEPYPDKKTYLIIEE